MPPPPPPSGHPGPAPSAPEPSDHELLKAVAADDAEAFVRLVERWRPRVVNFVKSRGADSEGAEDCAQETFIRVHGYRHSYRPEAPFSAFLFTVARNVLLDWKRSQVRHRDREGGPEGLDDVPDRRGPADSGSRLDLVAALATLPPHLGPVVELAGIRGLPYAAVAVLLGIPEGTVKSRMFHAVRRLRAALGGESSGGNSRGGESADA